MTYARELYGAGKVNFRVLVEIGWESQRYLFFPEVCHQGRWQWGQAERTVIGMGRRRRENAQGAL